ncbi:MAG: hypothetical protein K0R38_4331 [Polyangiaceae bacterium]|jgi:hypothetical protein|nr:hypothetical protein [Polyangiaceae bacterium]
MSIRTRLGILFTIVLGGCAAEVAPDGDADAPLREAESLGEAESALCKNGLSPAQEKTTLKLIDDICGDTWCEGDNNFAFLALKCRAGSGNAAHDGTCTLKLDIIPRVDETPAPRYRRTCTTSGFNGFTSLVTTSTHGYQALQPAYYDALSECINQLEEELPR